MSPKQIRLPRIEWLEGDEVLFRRGKDGPADILARFYSPDFGEYAGA